MASDNKIIELIKQGDIAAFNTCSSLFISNFIYIAENLSHDPEDAKDILQNVFLRFWEKRENIDNSHVFKRLFIQGYTERMPQLPSFYRNSYLISHN